MTSLFNSTLNAVKKALHAGPVEFLAAISLGGLSSLMPSESVVAVGVVLCALLILDLFAGATAAVYRKEFDGNKLFMRTVAKFTGYACSVLAIYGAIWAGAQAARVSDSVKGEGVAGAMLILLYLLILHEARSVVINAAKMDLPILRVVGRWLKRQETKAKAALDDE